MGMTALRIVNVTAARGPFPAATARACTKGIEGLQAAARAVAWQMPLTDQASRLAPDALPLSEISHSTAKPEKHWTVTDVHCL
jgi:hypothetical protein